MLYKYIKIDLFFILLDLDLIVFMVVVFLLSDDLIVKEFLKYRRIFKSMNDKFFRNFYDVVLVKF